MLYDLDVLATVVARMDGDGSAAGADLASTGRHKSGIARGGVAPGAAALGWAQSFNDYITQVQVGVALSCSGATVARLTHLVVGHLP